MKKFYIIILSLICTISLKSENYTLTNNCINPHFIAQDLKTVEVDLSQGTGQEIMPASENAPVSIIGKSYVSFYNYGENKLNSYFNVKEAPNDSIILENFACGYDVKAKYDSKTGTVTIPTGMVIGKWDNKDLTLYSQIDQSIAILGTAPIVGTVDGDKISFNNGLWLTELSEGGGRQGVIIMNNIKAVEGNAKMTYTAYSSDYCVPLIVSKTNENEISILGLSSMFNRAKLAVPAKFDKTANTASISLYTPVDISVISGDYHYLRFLDFDNQVTRDVNFTVSVSDNESTLNATTDAHFLYVGYDANGKVGYGIYVMKSLKISVDFNLYTEAVDDNNRIIDYVIYSIDKESKTAQVNGCSAGVRVIDIPSVLTINDTKYGVTTVKEDAFKNNKDLVAIYLPSSLKNVGTDAFRNMTNLKNLYIEDLRAWCSVEFANNYANPINNVFPNLEKDWGKVYFNRNLFEGVLNIPDGVSSIGRSFCGLKSLKNINFPGDGLLISIGDQAFGNVTGLTEVRIPSSVRSVGSAFSGCENLTSVTLSEGLEDMGNEMFYRCTSLKEITIPSTVRSIGHNTFMSCRNITEIKSLSVVPPVCNIVSGMTPFDDFRSRATLRVPADAIEAYRKAAGWNRFANIVALDGSSGIETVEGDEKAEVEYFNLQGQRVPSDLLDKGIYIVRRGSKVSKVYVK